MTPARPRAYFVSAADYERGIDDPGLGALAADGWSVVAATVVQRGRIDASGEPVVELMLVLWPPPRLRLEVSAAPASIATSRRPLAVVAGAMVLGALIALVGVALVHLGG